MNSDELKTAQKILEKILVEEINDPMTNYDLANSYITVIQKLDTKRRETWHDEKFGESEKIVDNVINTQFTADDIPF